MKTEEHDIQCACVNLFRLQYPEYRLLLFAVPNGGLRSVTTAKHLKAEGVMPGVSDLILLIPNRHYHGLLIEMKKPSGRQTASQVNFQTAAEKQGYLYAIAHSIDEFMNIIKNYFNNMT